MATTRSRTATETERDLSRRIPPARRRRKSLRAHFRDGLEAALTAEPKAFAATKPRTMMGLIVRELVSAAAEARCDAIKLVFAYVAEADELRTEAETNDADDNSQGISGPEAAEEPKWDWDAENGWDASEREKDAPEHDAQAEALTQAKRQEIIDQFNRIMQATRENEIRRVRLEAEQASEAVANPPPAPFSGNFDTTSKATIRIGGKLVEG